MSIPDISFVPVLASTVVYIAVGTLWYSPKLFGDRWKNLKNVTSNDMSSMNVAMITMVVSAVIMSLLLNIMVIWAGANTLIEGAGVGFFAYGIVAAVAWTQVVFGNDSELETRRELFFIDYGFPFVSFLIMGGVLAVL